MLARWERLASLAQRGSVAVQLRDRTLCARELLALGHELRDIARRYGQALVVNDRLDIAQLLGAEGVHLGESSVESADARRLVGSRWLFRACHSADRVALADADAVLLSPICAPRKGSLALGLAAVEVARRALDNAASRTHLFALGGVCAADVASCLQAGAHGVAAVGAAFGAEDPLPLVRALGITR